MKRATPPREITEQDVLEALARMGDDILADYKAQRLSKADAYALTARGLRQAAHLRRATRRAPTP